MQGAVGNAGVGVPPMQGAAEEYWRGSTTHADEQWGVLA